MAEDKKKDEIAVIEINEEFMKQKLYEFRGCKVLLDADLAEVYGYEVISGHRRNRDLIGQRYFDCMKAIVKNDAT